MLSLDSFLKLDYFHDCLPVRLVSLETQSGTVEGDFVKGIAMSEDGSVVLVGYTSNYQTSSTATSSGRTDCVAIKLDADGIVQWTWQVTSKTNRCGLWAYLGS